MKKLIKETSGIYKITCLSNKKIYIGSSINIKRRLKDHTKLLRGNKHLNKYMQKDWNKYGEKNFKFEIIEIIYNISKLIIREKFWINKTSCCNRKVGFNISSNPYSLGVGRFIDLIGQKFGRLLPIKSVGKNRHGQYQWLCKCSCGEEKIIDGNSLRNSKTKSCGCLRRETSNKTCRSRIIHGYSNTPIYSMWQRINGKCKNKNNIEYKNYVKQGVSVCYRWSDKNPKGFQNFYEDVGDPPEGLTLDRINNRGDYKPNNWRWATVAQQHRNTRRNINITFNNKTQCLKDWAKELNIKYTTLWVRICAYKWPIEKAFTTPVLKYKKR